MDFIGSSVNNLGVRQFTSDPAFRTQHRFISNRLSSKLRRIFNGLKSTTCQTDMWVIHRSSYSLMILRVERIHKLMDRIYTCLFTHCNTLLPSTTIKIYSKLSATTF